MSKNTILEGLQDAVSHATAATLFKVAVTGGRDLKDKLLVQNAMDNIRHNVAGGDMLVVDGGCPTGADFHVRQWCKQRKGVWSLTVWAPWEMQGKAAGPMRNAFMAKLYAYDVVVAFPGGRGTSNATKCFTELGHTIVRAKR